MKKEVQNLFESFNKYKEIAKPQRLLKEDAANDGDDIELYMNTWGNYNEYGADVDKINGGWMSVEKAKEFLDAHKEEEPFINDTENVPEALDIDEYSNPWTAIEQIEFVQGVDDTDAFLAILEDQGDFESAKDIYESGDFTFFPGVDNDFDLGKAWFDMVGGVDGIQNPQNYVNREYVKDAIVNDLGSDEDYSDDELLQIFKTYVDEQDYILDLLERHRSEKADESKKIWVIYMFLVWYEIYFNYSELCSIK